MKDAFLALVDKIFSIPARDCSLLCFKQCKVYVFVLVVFITSVKFSRYKSGCQVEGTRVRGLKSEAHI